MKEQLDSISYLNHVYPQFKFALREDLKDDKRFLPTRSEPKATGWDVRAAIYSKGVIRLKPFQKALIPIGFRAVCPEGWWYKLNPRSSTFAKKDLSCLYGVIDETFESELMFACQYIPEIELYREYLNLNNDVFPKKIYFPEWSPSFEKELVIDFGDAIGQIIPVKREEMEVVEISNKELDKLYKERNGKRGIGGFGSSDKKKVK